MSFNILDKQGILNITQIDTERGETETKRNRDRKRKRHRKDNTIILNFFSQKVVTHSINTVLIPSLGTMTPDSLKILNT